MQKGVSYYCDCMVSGMADIGSQLIVVAGVASSEYFASEYVRYGMKEFPRIGTKFTLMNSSRVWAYRSGPLFAAAGFAYSSWSCAIQEYGFLTK